MRRGGEGRKNNGVAKIKVVAKLARTNAGKLLDPKTGTPVPPNDVVGPAALGVVESDLNPENALPGVVVEGVGVEAEGVVLDAEPKTLGALANAAKPPVVDFDSALEFLLE